VLVADDQLVQKAGILPLEPLRDGQTLLPHLLIRNCGGTFTE
jgi:hypothetical protein